MSSTDPSTETPHDRYPVAVACRELTYAYGTGAPALAGFKWEVPTRAIAALLGGSGAGKSTALALMAGVLPRQAGSVTVWGGDPAEAAGRRSLGYMPQLGGVDPHLSVEATLAAYAQAYGLSSSAAGLVTNAFRMLIGGQGAADAVNATIDLLDLERRRKQAVGELPAGMQRRVSLGIALLDDPEVLLLDDPFAMQPHDFVERLWAHFAALTKRGRTIVFATADPATALRASLIGVMRTGRVVASADPATLRPGGRARVMMRYQTTTGRHTKELDLADYRTELAAHLAELPAKPLEVVVTPENELKALMALLTPEA